MSVETFGEFPHKSGRPPPKHGVLRDDGVRGENRVVEDLAVILEYASVANYAVLADMNIVSNAQSTHDGATVDENRAAELLLDVLELLLVLPLSKSGPDDYILPQDHIFAHLNGGEVAS